MNLRNFSAKDFSEVHPSGALGLKLNKAISEIFLKKHKFVQMIMFLMSF